MGMIFFSFQKEFGKWRFFKSEYWDKEK